LFDVSNRKFNNLRDKLRAMGSVLIAFSGGVDSTFLLKVAHDVLGNKVLAVTAESETYPQTELKEAKKLARMVGANHQIIRTRELKKKNFSQNLPTRCYFCKRELFSDLKKIASRKKIKYVLDASNFDDLKDYRPGRRAAKELGVKSPLAEAGLTKKEIRFFSRKMGLPTWSKPAQACLASRIPYGESITKPKLTRIAKAESFLRSLGIKILRVRYHRNLARIETVPDDLSLVLKYSSKVAKEFRKLGFNYVTLDLEGYRTGSLNEVLKLKK